MWEERDEARRKKYKKLNNEVLSKVAHDKQAKIGCKGGTKFLYGYKKHVSVDKATITPANVNRCPGI
ncbi:hypothetical protein MIDIC_70013 [Alphaproteobacteria bacterium]